MSRITYVRYESDMRNVRGPELMALAELYHVTVDYILGGSDEIETQPADDDELRTRAIERVQSLPDPALTRVLDFLDGLEAGRDIAAAEAAADDPNDGSSG